ncbi:MAG: glycosyltransferase family 4 protein [Bdellovibrionaceae bacterium]|jgi:glycosyltransferase involved in cell wall biosynthesis|nr:glycosyltransferase family 4 protein [Pseudobdellovibrionaceae bacterium]
MSKSVLYIHSCGSFGGSSRSLTELLLAFSKDDVSPYILTQRGHVCDFFKKAGAKVISVPGIVQFDNTNIGYYRSFRWLILLREFYYLIHTIFGLLKARRNWKDIQIIHINDITPIFAGIIAKILFRKPLVMHVRCLHAPEKTPLRSQFLVYLIHKYVDQVISIDETVKASLPNGISSQVIHNGFNPDSSLVKGEASQFSHLFGKRKLNLAIVGGLIPLKGIMELLKAAKMAVDQDLDINFFIVGKNPRQLKGAKAYVLKKLGLAHDMEKEIRDYIKKHKLGEHVHLLGFLSNTTDLFKNIDVLCFPSHLDAPGRPVFEAALMKKASIIAISNPKSDSVIANETAICIPSKDPDALFKGILHFYNNPLEVERMGELAYRLAEKNFNILNNANKMAKIYDALLSKS